MHPSENDDTTASRRPAPDPGEIWRPRPRRLAIGFALIAIGLVWMILNGVQEGSRPQPTPVPVHGPAATAVQTIAGLRVRPVLPPTTTATSRPLDVLISFHNDGPQPREISPRDIALLVEGRRLAPLLSGYTVLPRTRLSAGHFVTGTLRFAASPAPGMVLVYTPSWDAAHPLRWLLWH